MKLIPIFALLLASVAGAQTVETKPARPATTTRPTRTLTLEQAYNRMKARVESGQPSTEEIMAQRADIEARAEQLRDYADRYDEWIDKHRQRAYENWQRLQSAHRQAEEDARHYYCYPYYGYGYYGRPTIFLSLPGPSGRNTR